MSEARPIKTTYYGWAKRGQPKPVVKITHSSRIEEALPNVARFMTRKAARWNAVVAEVIDTENFDELLLVATYWPGEKFNTIFEKDVSRPVCLTNIEKLAN